jgi:HEAT repeat protein
MNRKQDSKPERRILDATLAIVSRFEASDVESVRLSAIRELAGLKTRDAARALIDALDRSLWRETRVALLRALGDVADERATMRLVRTASDTDDLVLAAEAMIALGASGDLVACEFLTSVIQQPHHPLTKEALMALCNAGDFPCEPEIAAVLSRDVAETPPTVMQFAILAAGLQGMTSVRPLIHTILRATTGEYTTAVSNAALVTSGRIGDEETFAILSSLDYRYRFFANQLREAALERLRLRLKWRVEDAVSGVLAAETPRQMSEALRLAAGFEASAVREAFALLAPEASLVAQSRVRSATTSSAHLESDLAFIAAHGGQLPVDELARLTRALWVNAGEGVISKLEAIIPRERFLAVAARCRMPKSWIVSLEDVLTSAGDDQTQLAAANVLTHQFWMAPPASEAREAIGAMLESAVDRAEIRGTAADRVARAIGETGLGGSKTLGALARRWKDRTMDPASVISTLGLIGTSDAASLLVRRWDDLLDDDSRVSLKTRQQILRALARCGALGDARSIGKLSPQEREDSRADILDILGANKISGMTGFVLESLVSRDFDMRLRAIVAAKHNHNAETWDALFGALDHPNACLAGRALDSIAVGGSVMEHTRLLKWAVKREDLPRASALKIARGLNLREGADYREAVALLADLLARDGDPWRDAEVRQSLLSTRDHLMVVAPAGSPQKPKGGAEQAHAIDNELVRAIPTFGAFSRTVKSVLRNAELTWLHPELFDQSVDKSTVVVQYVKSLDILLQESLGAAIFHSPAASIPSRMHARLLQFQFDEPDISASQAIQTLQCGHLFTAESFPYVKFQLICQSVLSGRLFRDQYRVIDGLRAWAVLILLFGRPLKHRGVELVPILPLNGATQSRVDPIVRALTELQDTRNAAAHRGTLLGTSEIENVRTTAFGVFRALLGLFAVAKSSGAASSAPEDHFVDA